MKQFTSKTQKIGQIGEEIACKYLKNKGFTIIDRNFTLKCGEIDIIATKNGEIRFFEVKTLLYKGEKRFFRPEDNINQHKLHKFIKACLVYVEMRKISNLLPWQIDAIAIEYDKVIKRAYVRHLECIY